MNPVDLLRKWLLEANLSQRAAARELEISDRRFRAYCAGSEEIPKMVILAVEGLARRNI